MSDDIEGYRMDALKAEAEFLLDRLDDLVETWDTEEAYNDYCGHVAPSAARLRSILSTLETPPLAAQDGETAAFVAAVQLVEDTGWVVLRPEQVITTSPSQSLNAGDGEAVYLVHDWEYTGANGDWDYARTPERAERLKAAGVKLTPVYTRHEPSEGFRKVATHPAAGRVSVSDAMVERFKAEFAKGRGLMMPSSDFVRRCLTASLSSLGGGE